MVLATSLALASFNLSGANSALSLDGPRKLPPVEVDFTTRGGLRTAETGARAFDNDAAVGLLSLSVALLLNVAFFTGGGSGGWAIRERAREAAVGAKSPLEGVLGLEVPRECDAGVFGREGVEVTDLEVARGVRDTDVFDATDCPVCCGLRGCEGVAERDVFGGWVLASDLTGKCDAVEGRLFKGDKGARFALGVGVDVPAVFALPPGGPGLADSGEEGAADVAAVTSTVGLGLGALGLDGPDDGVEGGNTDLASVDATDFSFFSLDSSLAGSLIGGRDAPGNDCRLFCCSKRPMRLATLWRGLSSGRGLEESTTSSNAGCTDGTYISRSS